MSQERRKFLRLNVGGVTCQITIGQETFEGELLDESIGGARVGSVPLLAISVNQPVTIKHDDGAVDGVCRSVARQADNHFTLGIRRSEAAPMRDDTVPAMLLNTFMEFGGCDLLCIPVASMADGRVRVMMIDGREFAVDRERLFSLTRQERIERLCSEQRFQNILQIYQLPLTDNAFDARDTIVEREFGPANLFSLAGNR